MTQEQPITPPPELVQQWQASLDCPDNSCAQAKYIAARAARWGADQELEACCKLLELSDSNARDFLYSARRPKPLSLKEQALSALYAITWGADDTREFYQDIETIKTALEALPDD